MIETLRAQLARITLRNAAIPTTLDLVEGDLRADGTVPIVLVVVLQVRDRDSGEPLAFRHCFVWPWEDQSDRLVPWAFGCVQRAWRHELDEALHFDGRRWSDPHIYADADHGCDRMAR